MKKIYIFVVLLFIPISALSAIKQDILEGTWYRTYGVYRPWTDDNQGTLSYYEEKLIFRSDDTVLIYDNSAAILKGKSIYTITIRDNQDFIVFHTPDQNPNDDTIQKKQGYFITLEHYEDKPDVLILLTVRENRNKKKNKGINYKKEKPTDKEPEFIVPNNKL